MQALSRRLAVHLPYGDLALSAVPVENDLADCAVAGALPQTVVLEVVETEPSVRGDTTVFKAARLASGARISVPQYIAQGERVLVDTHTGAFAGRAET